MKSQENSHKFSDRLNRMIKIFCFHSHFSQEKIWGEYGENRENEGSNCWGIFVRKLSVVK